MSFRVIGIFIAPDKGAPMEEVDHVQAIAGCGLEGDRYATGDGAYSKTKVGERDLTLFAQEALSAANAHPSVTEPFTPADTRRNILVEGGPDNLCTLQGQNIVIGDEGVTVRFTEECDPCKRPSKLAGKDGFAEAFKQDGRGGIRVSIVTGGEIKVGDLIRIEDL